MTACQTSLNETGELLIFIFLFFKSSTLAIKSLFLPPMSLRALGSKAEFHQTMFLHFLLLLLPLKKKAPYTVEKIVSGWSDSSPERQCQKRWALKSVVTE